MILTQFFSQCWELKIIQRYPSQRRHLPNKSVKGRLTYLSRVSFSSIAPDPFGRTSFHFLCLFFKRGCGRKSGDAATSIIHFKLPALAVCVYLCACVCVWVWVSVLVSPLHGYMCSAWFVFVVRFAVCFCLPQQCPVFVWVYVCFWLCPTVVTLCVCVCENICIYIYADSNQYRRRSRRWWPLLPIKLHVHQLTVVFLEHASCCSCSSRFFFSPFFAVVLRHVAAL